MPHQCLKCGKVFPSGSMEIFKGCSNCKGKRFFYTEQPISENERKQLTERADQDIKELVKDLLTQRRPEPFSSSDVKGGESGWVKVDKNKKVKAADEDTLRKTETPLAALKGPAEVKSKLQQILDEELEKGEIPEGPAVSKPDKAKSKPAKEKVEKRAVKAKVPSKEKPKKKEKPAKPTEKRKAVKKPTPGSQPEIITVVEPGVYEIDLEPLMDRSPIIILKDGTYLLHLPSLFNKPIKK